MGTTLKIPSVIQQMLDTSKDLDNARKMKAQAGNGKGVVQKDVSSTNSQYAHGPAGVFNTPGVDRGVYSTIIRPRGIASRLPLVPSLDQTPLFEIITSQTAGSGSEPTSECSTPVGVGNLKTAFLTAPYGRIIRKSDTFAVNRYGQVVNNAEPLDLRVVNDVSTQSPFVPEPAQNPDFINTELGMQYFKMGLEFERTTEPHCFTGDGSITGTRPDHGFAKFYGYDSLINSGKIDAIYGTLIPAADSLVVAWNNALVSGTTTLNGQSFDIVKTLSAIANYLYQKADRMGMMPVNWQIAMRWDLFFELTAIWPCSYLTNGCSVASASQPAFIDTAEQIAMRDDMRANQYLWINGIRYPVVISDGINETAGGGGARSDIYFIPISARGTYTNYLQYNDFKNPQITGLGNAGLGSQFWDSNNGLFLWTFQRDGYCAWLQAKMDIRMILRAPWLAARLTNVVYQTAIHTVDGFTSSLYPAPGGGSTVGAYGGSIYTSAV